MIQFIYPDYPLEKEYIEAIDSIDHFNIKHTGEDADACVVDDWDFSLANAEVPIILRTKLNEFIEKVGMLAHIISQAKRVNVVFTDVENFTDSISEPYSKALKKMSEKLKQFYIEGSQPQVNIITDRMVLSSMNNCGAGDTNITLAPNGKFYVCPAFYYDNEDDCIGDLEHGLDIKNKQLYRLDHAPICRHCDAYQCKRCIWLNRKTTLEVNTPSHEQCVVAHLERNASRELLNSIRKHGTFLPEQEEIKELNYLDPFDKRDEWQ